MSLLFFYFNFLVGRLQIILSIDSSYSGRGEETYKSTNHTNRCKTLNHKITYLAYK